MLYLLFIGGIVAASVLNRLAERFGVRPVFTGDIADRHQVADFCLEVAGWLFVNRRRILLQIPVNRNTYSEISGTLIPV